MTTAEHLRSITASRPSRVTIAGVAWPLYKVIALVLGFAVFAVVGVLTTAPAPAVLSGAATGALVWVVCGFVQQARS